MKNKISVVIPVYFNEGSLPQLFEALERVEAELLVRELSLELIFVDDGSSDNSIARLLEFKVKRPETKVVKLTRNFGAIKCSKTGLNFVTGDAFVILAADLQDPPNLIVDMVDKWIEGSRFVICERISRDDPIFKKIFAGIFYKLVRLLVMKNYPKGGFDLALMDALFLPYLLNSAKSVVPSYLAYWVGYKPSVLKYHRQTREYGKSRWTFAKNFSLVFDIILGFSVTPIRAISGFGAFVSILSFLYGGSVTISALLNKIPVAGFASLVALITFLLGLIIIMLGVIGEYLWRISEELNKRPESVIEKVW